MKHAILCATLALLTLAAAAPARAQAFAVGAADYPLESIIALEEGTTSLALTVDAAGRVTEARVAATSGYPRLDDAAVALAKTRTFAPGTVKADAVWKLPLTAGYDTDRLTYERDIAARARAANAELKFPVASGPARLDWNPGARREEGIVVVRYQVLDNGRVGRLAYVRRSHFNDMDEAVSTSIRNFWRFQPATLNGKPVRMWKFAEFYLGRGQSYSCPYHTIDHGAAECASDATSELDQATIHIRLAPNDPVGYTDRCFSLAAIGRAAEAIADCDKALSLKAGDAAVLDTRGFANFRLGQYGRAIADYSAAITANGRAVSSYYGRGIAKLKTGDASGAADIDAAKKLDAMIAEKMARIGIGP